MISRIKKNVLAILEFLIGVLFIIMTLATAAQVFCRYVLSFSLTWSHELTVLVLIWVVWLSVPIGLDRGQHLTVTLVVDNVSPAHRSWFKWLHLILSLGFLALVFFLTFPVIDAFKGMNLLTLPIPTNARYWAATVGSLLSVVVLAAKVFEGQGGT